MNIEDIKNAARDFSNVWAGTPMCKEDILRKNDYEDGFTDGAIWRINRIWNNVVSIPQNGKIIIALKDDEIPIICGPNNSDWVNTVKIFNFTKWAYIENLLPYNNIER